MAVPFLQVLASPWVGEQSVQDAGALVLGREHYGLPDVVVLLLGTAGATHHTCLHEGGPRVSQQRLDAPFVHLGMGIGTHTHTHTQSGGV